MKKYINRLTKEWKAHGRIIIAVDFDDTLSPWNLETKESIQNSNIIKILQRAHQTGAYIVCFTACSEDRYEKEVKKVFEEHKIPLDAINENPIVLKYGNVRKIYYNILIDDRAGLREALTILENAMYIQRGYLKSEKPISDVA